MDAQVTIRYVDQCECTYVHVHVHVRKTCGYYLKGNGSVYKGLNLEFVTKKRFCHENAVSECNSKAGAHVYEC